MDTEVQGLIGYFRRGAQTGRERFAITTTADGARTLRPQCEMWDDELLRDVTFAINADDRPLDAFIRLTQHWHGRDPGRLGSPVSSNAANGGTGPLIATTAFQLAHHGDETIRVAAGDFDCRHFSVAFRGYSPLHFWVTGSQHQFVRMEWDHLDANYELLDFSETQR
jgi:hypothetical protein